MFCPECGCEYRPGFTECADCRVPLVAEQPREPATPPNPDLAAVTVWEGCDPLLVASVESILDEAGIPYSVSGPELTVRYGPVTPLLHPARRFQVTADREREARALLAEFEEAAGPAELEDPQDPGSEI